MSAKQFNRAMGAAIKRLRKKRGLSLQQVGAALGVTYQQAGKYTDGANGLSAYYLPKLAALFGISIEQLYEQARINVAVEPAEPTPADNDAFLAARYVARIEDEKVRGAFVDFARKLAFQGGGA